MSDSKVLDIIITLRGAPDPLLGMMLDIARRCMSANGSAWQAHLQAELDTGLREAGIVAAPVTLAVNAALAEFFRPRKGLWFYDHQSFTDRVLTSARDDGSGNIEGCDHIDLPRAMYDREIIAEYLGGQYAFILNQVKTYLTVQANGEDGPLLTNGYANIFYVLGKGGVLFAVNVHWHSDKWRVRGWHLDEYGRWRAGHRIFRNKP